MDGAAFVGELKNGPGMEPEDNVFRSIWAEYERVILQSIVTSMSFWMRCSCLRNSRLF